MSETKTTKKRKTKKKTQSIINGTSLTDEELLEQLKLWDIDIPKVSEVSESTDRHGLKISIVMEGFNPTVVRPPNGVWPIKVN